MFFESHTCETAHICWPLEVDITHSRESKAPDAVIHWPELGFYCSGGKSCSLSALRTQLISFHQLAVEFQLFFLSFPLQSFHPAAAAAPLARRFSDTKIFHLLGIFWTRALKTTNSSCAVSTSSRSNFPSVSDPDSPPRLHFVPLILASFISVNAASILEPFSSSLPKERTSCRRLVRWARGETSKAV